MKLKGSVWNTKSPCCKLTLFARSKLTPFPSLRVPPHFGGKCHWSAAETSITDFVSCGTPVRIQWPTSVYRYLQRMETNGSASNYIICSLSTPEFRRAKRCDLFEPQAAPEPWLDPDTVSKCSLSHPHLPILICSACIASIVHGAGAALYPLALIYHWLPAAIQDSQDFTSFNDSVRGTGGPCCPAWQETS